MRSYIADTLIGIFAFDESGNILNFIDFDDNNDKIIEFYNAIENNIILKLYDNFLQELNNSGFNEFIFDNKKLEQLTSAKLGYKTKLENISMELKNFRLTLERQLKKVGIDKTQNEIFKQYKVINEQLTRRKVSQAGEKADIIIMQIIATLDIIKKTLSLFSTRLREWYGLHFPELTDKIVEDNMLLVNLVSTLGHRNKFTVENLKKMFELKEDITEKLSQQASVSMGADIDLTFLQNYANQILALNQYREELEIHLDELMEKAAPNINAIIGSLIGAKLIAKAGGLRKLAFMPASRIQLLGAEKALYRFLKTGEKRPKHGLIFQWNQIRSSKPWIRGKIARLVAGKIGLSAKVDFFSGDFIGDILSKEIDEKVKEIEEKYPNPPKKNKIQKTKQKGTSKKKRK
ncbi:MAG: C/D box methylation guide ribonucleoprotein complex aNOP56 subunit [Promethearchaeota archaeon]